MRTSVKMEKQGIIFKYQKIVEKLEFYIHSERKIHNRDEKELRFMVDELIEALHRLQDLEIKAPSVVS